MAGPAAETELSFICNQAAENTMTIAPTKSKRDYERMLKRIEVLMNAKSRTKAGDELAAIDCPAEYGESVGTILVANLPIVESIHLVSSQLPNCCPILVLDKDMALF